MLCFGFNATPLPSCLYRPLPYFRQAISSNRYQTLCTVSNNDKKRVLFLGTPSVAATVLEKLNNASKSQDSTFQLIGVVTQPPAPAGRKRTLCKSPVHEMAESLNISTVLTPSSARNSDFLDLLYNMQPDLCITAAYGQYLPKKFLSCPPYGTLNIHPSLLPKFRGAAPVPRALQAGVDKTGVSILFTVKEMDAGPVVAIRERVLDGTERSSTLLAELFDEGVDLLVETIPLVWNESIQKIEQNHDSATHAPKISKEEGRLSFTENARIVDAKVRAFDGWPGTWAEFVVNGNKQSEQIRLKVLETKVLRAKSGMCVGVHQVDFDEQVNCLTITCDDGSQIGVLRIQPPGKKSMDARSFWNGLRGKNVERKRVPH